MGFSNEQPVVCFIQQDLQTCHALIRQNRLLYAIEHPDEQVFTVGCCAPGESRPADALPVVGEEDKSEHCIFIRASENGLTVWFCNDSVETHCSILDLPGRGTFSSRMSGLIESDRLAGKRVAIVGLGSFGSHIALELAKCGVGVFGLFDFDRLEPANVTRHACGLKDVGRLKVNAVRDLILQCNPFVQVETFPIDINVHQQEFLDWAGKADVILCVTDENGSRVFCNEAGLKMSKTVLYGRAITRAEGGDVLRFRPGQSPCLGCLVGKGLFHYQYEEVSTLKQSKRDAQAYTDPDDVVAQVQVGLSTDIVPLWNMVVRLTLLELMRGDSGVWETLEEDLSADYYFWVNRRENNYAGLKPMQFSAVRPSILRWYGVKLAKDPYCLICGTLLP